MKCRYLIPKKPLKKWTHLGKFKYTWDYVKNRILNVHPYENGRRLFWKKDVSFNQKDIFLRNRRLFLKRDVFFWTSFFIKMSFHWKRRLLLDISFQKTSFSEKWHLLLDIFFQKMSFSEKRHLFLDISFWEMSFSKKRRTSFL